MPPKRCENILTGSEKMFRLQKNGNVEYYTVDSFEKTGLIRHCFSTKRGGVSSGIYESMNLRLNCDDSRENVNKNFELLCNASGINKENLILSHQVHEDKIINVGKSDCGNGICKENKFESADALITDEPGAALTIFFADCVPVMFLDVKKKVIALAHSGWKGTALKICAKTAERFGTDYKSDMNDIIVAVGPSIRNCHFEVGAEVAEIFGKNFKTETVEERDGKLYVSMQNAVCEQLVEAGIKKENITDSGICTFCNGDLLFSHRKTFGKRGVMAAIAELR